MERGGIKIRPITTKEVRNELLVHSTTYALPNVAFCTGMIDE
jgi:hypothetical protein